ncbi:hypothetical protein DL93DRAFT_1677223 [Clavulina sp. PMI_390]|nr:hypothetical protein DL93DRAFT_1677223 [Clavulina sp. PMI_390]
MSRTSSTGSNPGSMASGNKKRKRYDFGDEVIYLTDDEDDTGPAQIGYQFQKRFRIEGSNASNPEDLQLPGAWPESVYSTAGPSSGPFTFQEPPVVHNPYATAATVNYYDQSGFQMNYDDQNPYHPVLDVAGADHQERIKDFIEQAANDNDERLKVELRPHQLIGISWMMEQEKGRMRGGILADDMGLGKTVQAISLMVAHSPSATQDKDFHGTLIVAPAALLQQWKEEITEKTIKSLLSIRIHHGNEKLKSPEEVGQHNVIITSYQTLCSDFTKDTNMPIGPLASNEWHRIILDEAQQIRTRSTRTSICMALLQAKYRWCLTGTPVTNSLADLYPLIRFIKFAPWNDWLYFNDQIGKIQKRNLEVAATRANLILKQTLLRRTKKSKVEGEGVLDLGIKDVEVVEIDFTPEEREIYRRIEERAQQKVNKFLKAGTLMKNYAFVFVMMLRLRQTCNHPRLVTYTDKAAGNGETLIEGEEGEPKHDPLAADTPEAIRKRAIRDVGPEFVTSLQERLKQRAVDRITAELSGADDTTEEDEDCPICFDSFSNSTPVFTACKHKFCQECIMDVLKSPLRQADAANANDRAAAANSRPCPVCRQDIARSQIFKASAFEPTTEELEQLQEDVRARSGNVTADDDAYDDLSLSSDPKGKGKAKAEPNELKLDDLLIEEDHWEPSSKMAKMMEYTKTWLEGHPDDKIVMYSQWTTMIDMMTELLHREHISSLRFDGKMSRRARDEVLNEFKSGDGPETPRILIISLKCGGVGLNLVHANRVICLDLAWNSATENQAIDRVYRFGQSKDVVVKRLVIRNTIEDRILKLQMAKQGLSDAALGEGAATRAGRMSINDIKLLFNIGKH